MTGIGPPNPEGLGVGVGVPGGVGALVDGGTVCCGIETGPIGGACNTGVGETPGIGVPFPPTFAGGAADGSGDAVSVACAS